MHDELEKRLSTVFKTDSEVSSMPDAVVAQVRRCGHIRRAKIAAFGLAPIALAAGLIVMQMNTPSIPGSVDLGPEPSIAVSNPGDEYRGLIGSRELASIFADVSPPSYTRSVSEHVFRIPAT